MGKLELDFDERWSTLPAVELGQDVDREALKACIDLIKIRVKPFCTNDEYTTGVRDGMNYAAELIMSLFEQERVTDPGVILTVA